MVCIQSFAACVGRWWFNRLRSLLFPRRCRGRPRLRPRRKVCRQKMLRKCSKMARAIRNLTLRQNWTALFLQRRRRARAASDAVPPPPPVPNTPASFGGSIVDNVVTVTWDMSGVGLADGCSIEAKPLQNGAVWVEKGTTGPEENSFQFDAGGLTDWFCRIRAFNGSGYSAYSEEIELWVD